MSWMRKMPTLPTYSKPINKVTSVLYSLVMPTTKKKRKLPWSSNWQLQQLTN